MATISSPGLGSGLDVDAIVGQLVAIERRPIELLTQQKTTLQAKLSSFGLLKSYTTNVQDAVSRLADPTLWQRTTALSSEAATVSASSTAVAVPGNYSIQVSQLAQAHSLASGVYASSSASVGTGTLTIDLGSYDAGATFVARTPPASVSIAIGIGEDSLESVRAKINAANAGVTASIVKDASGARLAIQSSATGADSAIRISVVADTPLPPLPTDPPSLASLAYDPGVPTTSRLTQTLEAKNALATINGLGVSSTTNTFTDAIEGVSLNVARVTTTAVQVRVGADNDAYKKAVTDFVKSYNEISNYLSAQTKFDPDTKVAGALQGDRATLSLQTQLRTAIAQPSNASATYRTLTDLGIELQKNGTLIVNDNKLTAALGNLSEVGKAFSNAATAGAGATGIAVRLKALTTAANNSDGVVTTRSEALRASIKRSDTNVERYELRVAATRTRLLAQYGALDTKLSTLSNLNTYITQQFFNSSNSN